MVSNVTINRKLNRYSKLRHGQFLVQTSEFHSKVLFYLVCGSWEQVEGHKVELLEGGIRWRTVEVAPPSARDLHQFTKLAAVFFSGEG